MRARNRDHEKLGGFFEFGDDGRATLVGMSRGKKWDLEKETRDFKRENELLFSRLRHRRWIAHPANREKASKAQAAWRAKNKERSKKTKELWRKRNRAKFRAAERARHARYRERNRERIRERDREQHRRKYEAQKADGSIMKRRELERARYRATREPGVRVVPKACSTCGSAGHNRRTCMEGKVQP